MKRYLFLALVLTSVSSQPLGAGPVAEEFDVGAAALRLASADPKPPKRDLLENSPLIWKPTNKLAPAGATDLRGLEHTKLQVLKVADGRQNATLLGENKENATPRVITTADDVPAFVTEHIKQIVSANGISVVDTGATHVLKLELKRFYVEETNLYRGDVQLAVTLTDAGGKQLWSGTSSGGAQRFGRSYKADNYYEVLSDSLIEATNSLLKNTTFRDALAKQ
jgi:hypothetical protein